MNNDALRTAVSVLIPEATFEEGTQWVSLSISPSAWESLAPVLRSAPDLHFDFLFCLTGVDWKTHLSVVYHLTSTTWRHTLVVKVTLDRENPEVPTVSDIWRTAEFHEREAYDLFGIRFPGHPDLRRLFMTDDWNGWPLRKDYEDPVNMIKL
jgi:NADH/F420H2 dehydrogenase subunit C